MKEYQKIENLFTFDKGTNKFNTNELRGDLVNLIANIKWSFTEKIDGTNFRIHWDGHKLSFAGRTDGAIFSAEQTKFIMENLVTEEKTNLFEQSFMDKKVIIYGELFGHKIQHGFQYSPTLKFSVFDVEVGDLFLNRENIISVCEQLGFDVVPLIDELEGKTLYDGIAYVKRGNKSFIGDAQMEGVVAKPQIEIRNRLGERVIVKIKYKDINQSK